MTSVEKLPVGTILDGRYRLTGVLGEGGFSVVYKARQVNIKRTVAIKVLKHEVEEEPVHSERLIREAEMIAQLRHPNLVTIYDAGILESGHPFIVMEPFSGRNLKRVLRMEGALSLQRAIPLFLGALGGLAEAHKRGIVHRDLKPSNLLLTSPGSNDESLKLIDFGAARVQDGDSDLTGSRLLGTPAYFPPEYIKSHTVSTAMDVYQMGLILVEMLAGRKAIKRDTPYMYIMAHITGDLDIPDGLKEGPLGEIIRKATHFDVNERYPHATAFREALLTLNLDEVPDLPEVPKGTDPSGSFEMSISPNHTNSESGMSRSASIQLPGSVAGGDPAKRNLTIAVVTMAAVLVFLGSALGFYVVLNSKEDLPPAPVSNVSPDPVADTGFVIVRTKPPALEIIRADDGVSVGYSPARLEVDQPFEKPVYVQVRSKGTVSSVQRIDPPEEGDKVLLDMTAWISTLSKADPPVAEKVDKAAAPAEEASPQPTATKTRAAKTSSRSRTTRAPRPKAAKATPTPAAGDAPDRAETRGGRKPRLGTVDSAPGPATKLKPRLGTVDDATQDKKPSLGTVD